MPFTTSRRTTLLVASLIASVAASGVVPTGVARAQDDLVTVSADGRPVLRVGPADTSTAIQRALRIERRLATLLETPRALGPARVEPAGSGAPERVVTVSGVPVVTVTRADAELDE